jgi:hypothetical protein
MADENVNNQYGAPQYNNAPQNGAPQYSAPQNGAPQYSAPQYSAPAYEEPLSLGSWVITLLLTVIPFVNIVMLFVWAFGNSPTSKKNWARAQLIFVLIGVVLMFLFGASIAAMFSF